ncbi:Electron transfer flavoprotein alpha-subunit [Perkinsus olseni]|uniref:Electron transfer flavoprotein alpha-subunit n=1 Tax=Perkinsus olseni TaxID=32597 RepID=A0A7J6PLK0_PEROL|nr:Electron transfer flavoprotein alpha-subunit [Perkinsus olseni]
MDTAISVDTTELKENAAFVEVLLQAPEIPSEPLSPGHDRSTDTAHASSTVPRDPHTTSVPSTPAQPPPVGSADGAALVAQPSSPSSDIPMPRMEMEASEEMALAVPSKRARRDSGVPTPEGSNSAGEGELLTIVAQLKSGLWRAEIAVDGKKYRGPTRDTSEEAHNDRIRMDQARESNTLQQLLQEWDMTSQLLPKGVYYNKSKKAFIATIHQQVSFTEAENLNGPPLPRPVTMKYEGPSRHTGGGSSARPSFVGGRSVARGAPSGRFLQPHSWIKRQEYFTAQVSLHRKNFRGPPRLTLEDAIADRQRLTRAKEEGRVEEVWARMKEEYAQLQQLRRLTSTPPTGFRSLRGPGRPRGSVTRLAQVPLPDLAALTSAAESQPSYIANVVPEASDHEALPSHADPVVKLDVSHFECTSNDYNDDSGVQSAAPDEPRLPQ